MVEGVEVTGVALVQKRLHTVAGETAKAMERALVVAGIKLQRLSQKVVPVDTGALRASAFTRKVGSGFSTEVVVGYSTPYAIYVHEDLEAHHAPGKIAKYLEQPAREHAAELQAIVREEAQLGNRKAIPQLGAPDLAQHALLPIMARGRGSFVRQVGGGRVTYVQGRGWRKGRQR